MLFISLTFVFALIILEEPADLPAPDHMYDCSTAVYNNGRCDRIIFMPHGWEKP